jgi:serine/threonine-protein kinase
MNLTPEFVNKVRPRYTVWVFPIRIPDFAPPDNFGNGPQPRVDILVAVPMSFQIGDTIGDYQIVDVLGRGGMGKLFRVRNLISDRVDAMKIVAPDLGSNPEFAERFLREIKVHASLDHPNIAAFRTALRVENRIIMVMELVEGVDLDEKLDAGALEVQEAVAYTDQVLSALGFAHGRGVIHRDIKPANMIVTPAGQIKLTDFGIAHTAGDPRLTATGTALGSLYYMSPEQLSSRPADARSDLYSLGMSFYHMVTGQCPFAGENEYSLMAAQLMRAPVPPAEVNPRIPMAISSIIMKAVEKDPAARFQTAGTFQLALRGHADVTPPKGSVFPQRGTSPSPPLIDPQVLSRIEAALAPAVGPIAKQLVIRTARRSTDVAGLCRSLAEQIPDPAQRSQFLRSMEVKAGTGPASITAPAVKTLDPALVQAAKEKLAPYIGPIAAMLAERTARRTRTPEEFYEALAAEIPSEADRRKFLSTVR